MAQPPAKEGKREKRAAKPAAAKRVKPKKTAGKKDTVANAETARSSSKRVGAKPAEVRRVAARRDAQPPAANDAAAVEESVPKTGSASPAGRASNRKKSSSRRGIQLKSLGKPTGDGLN
jgi:hypothetical protein